MTFWIVAFLIMGALVAWFLSALRRTDDDGLTGAASDLTVYRDQLNEVDRDLAKGVLTKAEAETVRLEVSRRLLEADRRAKAAKAATTGNGVIAGALVVLATLAGGTGLYITMGAPGAQDVPIKARLADLDNAARTRMSQAEAEIQAAPNLPQVDAVEPKFQDLMKQLREALEDRPNDVPGLTLLARNEARLGNYIAARKAQDRLIVAKGEKVTPEDYATGLEMMVFAAGGYISPEAEDYLKSILRLEPGRGGAQYFLGLLHVQNGRPDLAFPVWRTLLENSPSDAPWTPVIRAEIASIAAAAGVSYTPPDLPGPTAEDRANAADMSAEDRQDMIRGMVEGLAERLATEGGNPEEWARLITALGVLGEDQRAKAIFDEAQEVFADNAAALGTIMNAGQSAGLIE
ncbi:MAG: c-type cytochrome biogenesis protein CcmI [Silicimonas sp.]|nr:c-type cytochrome biogenesis protein CcmI [Silicimonas sp.]